MDRPKRFESLDGLRGVCALMILFHHFGLVRSNVGLMFHAPLCVDVFFALSGFVIAAAYEDRLNRGLTVWEFVKRRAERLLPTHFIGTALAAAAMVYLWTKEGPSWWSVTEVSALVLGAIFLIPSSNSPTRELFPANLVLWSLLDEWVVNIAYAVALRKLSTRWVVFISATAWLLLLGSAMFLKRTSLNLGPFDGEIMPGILRATAGFMSGVAVFRIRDNTTLKRLFSRSSPALVYATIPPVCMVPHLSWDVWYDIVAMMSCPLLVAILATTNRATPRTFVWLGSISYPLYVSQFAPVALAAAVTLGSRTTPPLAVLALASAVPLAWAVGKLADRATLRPRIAVSS